MPAMFGLPDGSDCSLLGQLFVMACYGFILYRAAVLIGDGSEKLLLIYGPGIVGGLIIPILGAVPDGAIVLVSGLGSASEAQCQVATGVGTLAGSTIMLLTIPWAFSLFIGCRDYDETTGQAAVKANGRPKYVDGFKPMSSCVTTYSNTVSGAKIMIVSSISYLIVLVPAMIEKGAPSQTAIDEEHYPALFGFIICAVGFFAYSIFQVVDSRASTTQELEQTRLKFVEWQKSVGRKIANTDTAIRMTFQKFDVDGSGTIDREELQMGFKQLGLDLDRVQVVALMEKSQMADDDDKETLTEVEFTAAVKTWSRTILKTQKSGLQNSLMAQSSLGRRASSKPNVMGIAEEKEDDQTPLKGLVQASSYQSVPATQGDAAATEKEKLMERLWSEMLVEQEMDDEEEEEEQYLHLTDRQLIMRAMAQLMLGTLLCCLFSDPMVSVIGVFSDTINVSPFYVSFIVTPVASNAAEIYSSLIFASKRTTEGVSMGFSALYGAACMNNTFVLCIFCALVFFRELQWTFVAETLVILMTILIVGINGMRKTVKVWQGFVVISLFPLSLLLVAVLDPLLDDVTKC